ncbi:helix-turn-helix domain-containing protein [Nonomuraea sp. NPDC046570]|uniref:TetR/AcrR family transcriptional regulator n=1 Tax=Nonomuraea sp. NPDC046570 TaxID=3155255 RepID=UPI0033EBF637
MRADARRNRDHLVATARAVIAEEGPEVSLNEVARRAEVGPGTLYRHFPNRRALLLAVFTDRIETLCAQAESLSSAAPESALETWLKALLAHTRTDGGLSATMASEGDLAEEVGFDCQARLRAAAGGLLDRAQRAGAVRPDVDVDDLFQLVAGIAPASRAERLLLLALNGLNTHR